ncbi:hypothetical protein DPEC_G00027590 [Dallia pectoralis]|uniref:Uncharacterized protein n=1 Tax=Dallia pectoralis TaxID=75939 RepID=A0ACC2HIV4_DALPE|nr:hypothetical protein DPEC_G00027590 [Dallia pectoralis]
MRRARSISPPMISISSSSSSSSSLEPRPSPQWFTRETGGEGLGLKVLSTSTSSSSSQLPVDPSMFMSCLKCEVGWTLGFMEHNRTGIFHWVLLTEWMQGSVLSPSSPSPTTSMLSSESSSAVPISSTSNSSSFSLSSLWLFSCGFSFSSLWLLSSGFSSFSLWLLSSNFSSSLWLFSSGFSLSSLCFFPSGFSLSSLWLLSSGFSLPSPPVTQLCVCRGPLIGRRPEKVFNWVTSTSSSTSMFLWGTRCSMLEGSPTEIGGGAFGSIWSLMTTPGSGHIFLVSLSSLPTVLSLSKSIVRLLFSPALAGSDILSNKT